MIIVFVLYYVHYKKNPRTSRKKMTFENYGQTSINNNVYICMEISDNITYNNYCRHDVRNRLL